MSGIIETKIARNKESAIHSSKCPSDSDEKVVRNN